jgi:hypothetical protein
VFAASIVAVEGVRVGEHELPRELAWRIWELDRWLIGTGEMDGDFMKAVLVPRA